MADTDGQTAVNPEISEDIAGKVRRFLLERFGDFIVKQEEFRGDHQYRVSPEKIYDICEALMEAGDLDVRYLADITCVDWYGHDEAEQGRFEVVYNLCSIAHKYRFYLKVRLPEKNPTVRSLVDLWQGADWMEREVWDLFGVTFDGHPDLTRILTPDDFEGHPLRKDFPLVYEQPKFSWNENDPPEVIK